MVTWLASWLIASIHAPMTAAVPQHTPVCRPKHLDVAVEVPEEHAGAAGAGEKRKPHTHAHGSSELVAADARQSSGAGK